MTIEEQWAKLSPRERDAMVAEKVMGAIPLANQSAFQDGYGVQTLSGSVYGPLPHYSTDMVAAKKVADKVGLDFASYSRGWVAGSKGHMKDINGAHPRWLEIHPMLRTAQTAPEAICLAALTARSEKA